MRVNHTDRIEVLKAARLVADFASAQGVPQRYSARRSTYQHVGALLADAILQAGLNYRTVVIPRVERILVDFPETKRVEDLIPFLQSGKIGHLLDWKHPTKIIRFESLVTFLYQNRVDTVDELRSALRSDVFCTDIQSLHGIGPKTVDYLGCLVGLETIAVDRHIRTFATKAGVTNSEYIFLQSAFCFAADLLSISRRDFDTWVWTRETRHSAPQFDFAVHPHHTPRKSRTSADARKQNSHVM